MKLIVGFTMSGLAFFSATALADEMYREYRSARYLGMGDTGISLAEGADAIFYNPAGLTEVKSLVNELVLASPQATMSSNFQSLYNDYKKNPDALKLITSVANQPLHVSVQNFTGVAFRRIAFGLYQNASVNAFIGNDPIKGLIGDLRADARVGLVTGFARSFVQDTLDIGISPKIVHRAHAAISVEARTAQEKFKGINPDNLMSQYLTRGTGFGADVGAIWKLSGQSLPRFGLVVRNVGGLKYSYPVPGTGVSPPTEKQTIDVGFSLQPGTKRSYSVLAIDLRDALNVNKEVIYKRLHMGAKLSLQDVFGVMAGINQGYVTYGAFLNLKVVRAECGMFSEELGQFPGDMRSRRIFARIVLGWSQ